MVSHLVSISMRMAPGASLRGPFCLVAGAGFEPATSGLCAAGSQIAFVGIWLDLCSSRKLSPCQSAVAAAFAESSSGSFLRSQARC
jgi:hypothetical protein